jgi:hypothetical protein
LRSQLSRAEGGLGTLADAECDGAYHKGCDGTGTVFGSNSSRCGHGLTVNQAQDSTSISSTFTSHSMEPNHTEPLLQRYVLCFN